MFKWPAESVQVGRATVRPKLLNQHRKYDEMSRHGSGSCFWKIYKQLHNYKKAPSSE